MIRRILRRLIRRATKPAILWWIKSQYIASEREIQRLRAQVEDFRELEAIEHRNQVRLAARRSEIERGLA